MLILKYKIQVNDTAPAEKENLLIPDAPEKRYSKSAVDVVMMDDYEENLKKFMDKSRIYLKPELSLEELALQIKIPKHHLTQLLNDRFKMNFYNFINQYRIQPEGNPVQILKTFCA